MSHSDLTKRHGAPRQQDTSVWEQATVRGSGARDTGGREGGEGGGFPEDTVKDQGASVARREGSTLA